MEHKSNEALLLRKLFNGNLTLVITVVFTAGVIFAQLRITASAQVETARQVSNLALQMTQMKGILETNQRQAAENERRLVEVTGTTAENSKDIIRLMERMASERKR
jgi:hypothetical protein